MIQDTVIPTQKRSGAVPGLCAALNQIYLSNKWNEKVFQILEKKLFSKNNNIGRSVKNLWQIFVLSQVRLCKRISHDELHHLATHHAFIRQIIGVESEFGAKKQVVSYQSIIDKVQLLNDETVKELNAVIVEFGHKLFKKKRGKHCA